MRAYCGLNCDACGAYLATVNDDDAARQRVAEEWRRAFGHAVTAADINCDGCASGSKRLYSFCSDCRIFACAVEHKVPNCAHCAEYVCPTLAPFLEQVADSRDWLASEHARLQGR